MMSIILYVFVNLFSLAKINLLCSPFSIAYFSYPSSSFPFDARYSLFTAKVERAFLILSVLLSLPLCTDIRIIIPLCSILLFRMKFFFFF